jgi:uncharacterized protein involved in exopolysaccharide biosynthesis
VSGEAASVNAARGIMSTNIALVTDYSVAGRVVDNLGLASDPNLIAAYAKRPKSDGRDFRRWTEQLIIDNTKAKLLEDSAILEISYTSDSPENAKTIADAVRTAFIDTSLDLKRQFAEKNADWFEQQTVSAKSELDKAIAAEAVYERANGLAMDGDKQDVDTARLQAMSAEGAQGIVPPPAMLSSSQVAIELAQVDAQIAAQSKELGPNNPTIRQLQSQKANLQVALAKEQATQSSLAGIAASNSRTVERSIAAQKARVVGESDKIGKLNQLQGDVDLKREVFNKTMARSAELREESLTVESGLTPLASAAVPRSPSFPNLLLIIPGALAMGLALGLLTALLMELFGRRVRGVEDLINSLDTPLLGVIAAPPKPGRAAVRRGIGRLALPGRGRAAHA